jgi:hypothetical protein
MSFKRLLKYKYSSIVLLNLLVIPFKTQCQSLPVGLPYFEDTYRRSQLDTTYQNISFTIRPLSHNKSDLTWGTDLAKSALLQHIPNNLLANTGFKYKSFQLKLLPIHVQSRSNSNNPYGWNDGPMIPAKGLQTYLSLGLFTSWGPLSIQFKPEWVRAANAGFEGFKKEHFDVIAARYYDIYNKIDLPERFGSAPYQKTFIGQSSIRLNFDPISVGMSTENLWWGPGRYNSLLMSNTAPGFKHLTLNTNKPINTPIGTIESQIIAAWPGTTNYGVLQNERTYYSNPLYVPKPNRERYLSGMIFTWQPHWIKNLYLGIAKTQQVYTDSKDMNIIGFLPTFSFFSSRKPDETAAERQQMESLFFRWMWPENKVEIYGEWAHHNPTSQLVSQNLYPERNRAYVFGMSKILPSKKLGHYFMLNVEVTQLQETSINDINSFNTWYIHPTITPGYTHLGQPIGAGIGPGANAQEVELSWHKGFKKISLMVERYVHNNDFYYYAFQDSKDFRRHWVDLNLKAGAEWDIKKLLINFHLLANRSYNYNWYLLQKPGDPYFVPGLNKFNLQLQFGLNYSL